MRYAALSVPTVGVTDGDVLGFGDTNADALVDALGGPADGPTTWLIAGDGVGLGVGLGCVDTDGDTPGDALGDDIDGCGALLATIAEPPFEAAVIGAAAPEPAPENSAINAIVATRPMDTDIATITDG